MFCSITDSCVVILVASYSRKSPTHHIPFGYLMLIFITYKYCSCFISKCSHAQNLLKLQVFTSIHMRLMHLTPCTVSCCTCLWLKHSKYQGGFRYNVHVHLMFYLTVFIVCESYRNLTSNLSNISNANLST